MGGARLGQTVLPGMEWTLYSVRLRISRGVLEMRKTATGIILSLVATCIRDLVRGRLNRFV